MKLMLHYRIDRHLQDNPTWWTNGIRDKRLTITEIIIYNFGLLTSENRSVLFIFTVFTLTCLLLASKLKRFTVWINATREQYF